MNYLNISMLKPNISMHVKQWEHSNPEIRGEGVADRLPARLDCDCSEQHYNLHFLN